MKRMIVVLLTAVASLTTAALADAPALLSYQGVLTDAGGMAVSDGRYKLTFSIYNDEKTGTLLWAEDDSVTVTKGIFNAVLGGVTPLTTLPFDGAYYLAVSVEGGPELTPRTLIAASAYSINARAVRGTENVFPATGLVGIGTTNPTYPLTIVNHAGQVGLHLSGYDDSYSSIYVNAVKASATPAYGYLRQGFLRAMTSIDDANNWALEVGGSYALRASSGGNVTIGTSAPGSEKLTVQGGIVLGSSSGSAAGTMRWTGSDFEGYDGSVWKSFTAAGGSGLPSGATNQTLRHDGLDWVATSNLYNDGSHIGIGTTAPIYDLHIRRDVNQTMGLIIENDDTGANSTQRIDFADENGTVAGIAIFDNDNGAYPSQMRIFNNRAGGSLHLMGTGGSVVLSNNLVGVNVSDPLANLHVKGGNWDLDATNGDLMIGNESDRLKLGVATSGAGEGICRIRAMGTANTLMLGAGSSEVLSLDNTGTAKLGVLGSTGSLELYRGGVTNRMLGAYTTMHGGNLDLFDESGNVTAALETDASGTGGYLTVFRGAGQTAFTVDGNAGAGEPIVSITGSSKSATFDMDQSGTNVVQLPAASITATEIGDEPGVVTYTEGVATISLTSTISTIGSQTISAPAAGYVLVLANAQFEVTHTNGTGTDAIVGVSSSSSSLPGNQDIRLYLAPGMPSSLYAFPVSASAVFSVSAGSNTFYFLGREDSGDVRVYDIQLSCIYIPTAYGAVEPPAAVAGASDDSAAPARAAIDVAAQRAASEAAENARVERELAAMRAELEAVKAKLGNK